MNTTLKDTDSTTLENQFYKPLELAVSRAKHFRDCQQYTDLSFLKAGIGRVVTAAKTGRQWVQILQAFGMIKVGLRNFFMALSSKRRLNLLREVATDIRLQADAYTIKHGDPLSFCEELKDFEVYASDGHCHSASAHEEPLNGKKRCTNHIFSLNLRTHSLHHMTITSPAMGNSKEHEITALKRIDNKSMRIGVPKGTKVIHAYDPAIIDYRRWLKWKHTYGVYIITREKANSACEKIGEYDWDKTDPRNAGVIDDQVVSSAYGQSIRRVLYQDPVAGTIYSFLTTEMTLPPGVIAFLYKLRWDIEKVFNQTKNKFGQMKAWAKTETSKVQQANFIALAHNLILMLEKKLEFEEGITDEKVRKKQLARQVTGRTQALKVNRVYNVLVDMIPRATERSLQFIRWLDSSLKLKTLWKPSLEELRPLMQKYLQ